MTLPQTSVDATTSTVRAVPVVASVPFPDIGEGELQDTRTAMTVSSTASPSRAVRLIVDPPRPTPASASDNRSHILNHIGAPRNLRPVRPTRRPCPSRGTMYCQSEDPG